MLRRMRWIIVSTALLCAVITACVSPRRDGDWWLSVLETNPDGSACKGDCLFGAALNDMSASQMDDVLAQHPMINRPGHKPLIAVLGAYVGQTVDLEGGTIGLTIHFHPVTTRCADDDPDPECYAGPNHPFLEALRHALTLGRVIRDFGSPDFITHSSLRQDPIIELYYPRRHMYFSIWEAPQDVMRPSDLIEGFTIYPADLYADIIPELEKLPWTGVTEGTPLP